MVETILIHIPTRISVDRIYIEVSTRPVIDQVAILSCAVIVAGLMIRRQFWRRGRSKVSTPIITLHVLAALSTGALLSFFGPIRREAVALIPFVKHEPGPIDMIPAFTSTATLIVTVFAAILWIGDIVHREALPPRPTVSPEETTEIEDQSPRYSSNRVGCAIALLMSIGLLSSMAALLRAALEDQAITASWPCP